MLDEPRLDVAVRNVARMWEGARIDRLVWMESYIPICGENSPYVRLVRKEYARLAANG